MALLSSDTLTGCTSIPSFIGGNSDTPGNPAYMIFNNTNSPPSWVKDISHNNKALRVIGGPNGTSISAGGSVVFTTVLSSGKTFTNITNSTPVSGSLTQNSSDITLPVTQVQLTSSTHTPSTATMAMHQHIYYRSDDNSQNITSLNSPPFIAASANTGPGAPLSTGGVGPADANVQHAHTVTAPHTHPFTLSQHNHNFSTTTHSHQITMNENFSVRYVDVIIAKKS